MWHDVQRRRLRSPVVRCNTTQNLLGIVSLFSGFNKNIPIAVVVEYSCIDHVVFALQPATLRVLFDEIFVREFTLGVFVEKFGVRMLY
jgi:hypothetical protein